MKLVYLANAPLPSRAAHSVHIMKMSAAFAALGHDVTLVVPAMDDPVWASDGGIFEHYGVPASFRIERLTRRPGTLGEYRYAVGCAAVVRRTRPDLVVSRYLMGSVAAALTGAPGLLELHQLVPNASRVQRPALRWLMRRPACRGLVVITEPLRELFEADGVPSGRIVVAPDGADLPGRDVTPWPRSSERLQVGYVGHLYEGRGEELLLAVAARAPWMDLHVVGGTEDDIARVRGIAQPLSTVTVHGYVSPRRAEEIRLGMDVLVAPYQDVVGLGSGTVTTERWMSPLKIFEYMAAGKAVVSSDLPILREVLTHEVNSLLCPPADVDAWVDALRRLDRSPELRRGLGERARADLEEKYQWKIRARRLLEALA